MRIPIIRTLSGHPHSGARILELDGHNYFFSDDVCIGYSAPLIRKLPPVRRKSIGTNETQRRHAHDMGIMRFRIVTDAAFLSRLPPISIHSPPHKMRKTRRKNV